MTQSENTIKCNVTDLISSVAIMLLSFIACLILSYFITTGYLYQVISIVLIYIPGVIYLYKKYPIDFRKELQKPLLTKYAIIGLSIIVLSLFIRYYYTDQNQVIKITNVQYESSIIAELIYLLSACIIIPICEEILFRYYYYGTLKYRYGLIVGVIVSNLLFIGVHVYHPHPLAIVFQGLLYTYLYEKSNSIWTSIIVHSSNNIMWHFVTYISMVQ
jgi:membrane protease YdiL (CAAX protease family)